MMEVVKGLRRLKLWIKREADKQFKEKLRAYYNKHVDEVSTMKKFLEESKMQVEDVGGDQMHQQ